MRRLTPIAIFASVAVLFLAVGTLTLSAQEPGTRVVFVDSQAVIRAHPGGAEADRLRDQAEAEVSELRASIDQIAQRARAGEQLTPAENERYQTLLTTLQAVQARYQEDIQAAAQPAIEAVNETIRQIAQENDYAIVMDIGAAGVSGSGVVVYADESLDITPVVLEAIEAEFGSSE